MLFPERLKYFRQENGLTEEQFGELFELSSSTIRLYECGKLQVNMEKLEQFAKFFDISPGLLLGTQYPDLPIEEALASYRLIQELIEVRKNEKKVDPQGAANEKINQQKFNLRLQGNIAQLPSNSRSITNNKMIPVFSRINAEESLFAEKNIEFYWPISETITREYGLELRNYFYLRVQGNNMEPTISDQDIVLVKKQIMVNNNEMAVILPIKEDALVSRIIYQDGKMFMEPDNKTYSTQTLVTYDYKIIGKVLWKTTAPRRN